MLVKCLTGDMAGLEGRAIDRDNWSYVVDCLIPLLRGPRGCRFGAPGDVVRTRIDIGDVRILRRGLTRNYREGLAMAPPATKAAFGVPS